MNQGEPNQASIVTQSSKQTKVTRQGSILSDRNHHSLKKLVQLKMLPPLHPQTDSKLKTISKNCPEELHEDVLFQINHPQLRAIAKSEQLVSGSTAKFGFSEVEVNHSLESATLTLEPEDKIDASALRQSNPMGLTFGKLASKLEKHRYTEMQEGVSKNEQQAKESQQKHTIRSKSKFFVPRINLAGLQKMEKAGFKLGKYESIYKPRLGKENRTIEASEPVKYTRNTNTPIIERLQPLKPKQKACSILPPISAKYI